MIRRLALLASLGLFAAGHAHADMYQDASNAKLPATGVATTWVCGTSGGALISLSPGCGVPITVGTDQNGGAFGSYNILGGNAAGLNAIIGEVTNTLPNSTYALPSGTLGYGKLPASSVGNQVFGVYGLAELFATGGGVSVAAEFTARNLSGVAPDIVLPPNTAIGTTTHVVTGTNVTCGTTVGSHDCSMGILVGNETGLYSDSVFNTALYLGLFRQYGLVVETMPSGTQTSAVLKNNGNGINLQLITQGGITPNNAVISVVDNTSTGRFTVRQNGMIFSGPMQTPKNFGGDAPAAFIGPQVALMAFAAEPSTGQTFADAGLYMTQANGTVAAPTRVNSGQQIWSTSAYGYDGASYIPSGRINMVTDTGVAAGIMPTSMLFWTEDTSGTLKQRLKINADGAVLFGIPGGAPISGSGNLSIAGGIYVNGVTGQTCSGTPTSSFASAGGVVTHC